MIPSTIISAFKRLENSGHNDSTVLNELLNRTDERPDVVTIKKGTILYLSRDKRLCRDNDVVTSALSIDYYLYTEDPVPRVIPSDVKDSVRYKKIGEYRFYANRVYNKVILDRDIRLLDLRGSVNSEYYMIKTNLLNVDGTISCKRSNDKVISLHIDNILDLCTLVKRIRPMSKDRYIQAKTLDYTGDDLHILNEAIIDRSSI